MEAQKTVQRNDSTRRRYCALLVGVDIYQDRQHLQPLPSSRADVEALSTLLVEQWGPQNVTVLTGEYATKDNALSSLKLMSGQLAEDGILLFYFSGHGYHDLREDRSYLLTADSTVVGEPDAFSVTNAVSVPELLSIAISTKSFGIVFITDACHPEGPLDRSFSFPPTMPENIAGIASSRPNELSYYLSSDANGLFTKYLLEALRGSADRDRKGSVTVLDIFRYVSQKVRDTAANRLGVQQTPVLTYRGVEDFAIVRTPKQQEEIDAERLKAEAGSIYDAMINAARVEEWAEVLDQWDLLLKADPNYPLGFSTALEARQKRDEESRPYDNEDRAEIIVSYPRVWLCRDEPRPIHPDAHVTHPDAQKGDILLQARKAGKVTELQRVFVAKTNAFPGWGSEGRVNYYVLAEDDTIDLSRPPTTANLIKKYGQIPRTLELLDDPNYFAAARGDLRATGEWDDLRFAILREHTIGAKWLLKNELEPLSCGRGRVNDLEKVMAAADHLFDQYRRLIGVPKSLFDQQTLDSERQGFDARATTRPSGPVVETPPGRQKVAVGSPSQLPPDSAGSDLEKERAQLAADYAVCLADWRECRRKVWDDRVPLTERDRLGTETRRLERRVSELRGQAERIGILDQLEVPDMASLKQNLLKTYSLDELRALCFELYVDPEELAGETKSDKCRSLLLIFRRQGRLSDLIRLLRKQRPHVGWNPVEVQALLPPAKANFTVDELIRLLTDRLSLIEIRDVCFDLDVDYEDLPPEKGRMIDALVKRYSDSHHLGELSDQIARARPDVVRTTQEPPPGHQARLSFRPAIPSKLVVGDTLKVRLTVRNEGTSAWPTRESSVSCKIASEDAPTKVVKTSTAPLVSKAEKIDSSEKATASFPFVAPEEPGNYLVSWVISIAGQEVIPVSTAGTPRRMDRFSAVRAQPPSVDEAKLPSGDTEPQAVEVTPTSGETEPPAVEVKPPSGEVELPVIEAMLPIGEAELPVVEAKPPSGKTEPPVVEAKPSGGETGAPVVEPKPLSGEAKPPTEEVKPPTGEIEPPAVEIKPPSGETKPPTDEIKRSTLESSAAPRMVQLRVDAAVPEQVQVDKSFDLAVSVRQPDQPRLSLAELPKVESGVVHGEMREDATAISLRVEVSAPECTITGESSRIFRLPRSAVPPTFVFQLIPKRIGKIGVVVNVYQQDEWLGSANIHTEAQEQLAGQVEFKVYSRPVSSYGSYQTIIERRVEVKAESRDVHTIDRHTLDIHLTPRADTTRYKYQALLQFQAQVGNAVKTFEGPLALPDNIERMGRGEEYGKALFGALFNAEVDPGPEPTRDGYNQIKGQAGDRLRLQIRINSEAVWLHTLGWEYLCDHDPLPLGCDPQTPLARVLHVTPSAYQLRRVDEDHPLRILAAMASPSDLKRKGFDPIVPSEFRSLAADIDHIRSLLGAVVESRVVHSPTHKVSLALLRDRLSDARTAGRPVNVLHLFCHGHVTDDGTHCLVLHAEGRASSEYVSDKEFAKKIAEFARGGDDGLRLVVLASCLSAEVSNRRALQGVARELVTAGIPAVVAMAGEMEFEAGRRFAQRFYAHLMTTGEVDSAVNVARSELYQRREMGPRDERQGRVSADQYGVPVLFMNIPDGKLFDKNPGLPPFSIKTQPLEQFSVEDAQALKDAALDAAAERLSGQLGDPPRGLARQLFDRLQQAQPGNVPPYVRRPRLFDQPGQEAKRLALIKAAASYRGFSPRRTVLFLRGEVRREIAGQLEKSKLDDLCKTILRGGDEAARAETQFWERIRPAGTASRGDLAPVSLGGCGPDDLGAAPVPVSDWRTGRRGFDMDSGKPCADAEKVTLTGNLTWPDDVPATPTGSPADLRRLLYDTQNDTWEPFSAFDRLIEGQVPERVASLLIHALACDQCVPYEQDHAGKVFTVFGLTHIDATFRGYCKLARDLLADEDLEFDDLADVFYFLQRLADGKETLKVAVPAQSNQADDLVGRRPTLHPVTLTSKNVDSGLVIHTRVIEQAVAALNSGKHIILLGPPGTGKTTLAEDLCRSAHDLACNRSHMLVTATADWTTFDTIGGYMPRPDNRLVFRPGIFLRAIESGKWLVIDEINRADIDKAFGELFTVLSNQVVTLPYAAEDGRPVRILPPGRPRSEQTYDYVIDPSWRIIGTMNVYDKASLFSMSLAFMRRFAFIDVAIPHPDAYHQLIKSLLKDAGGGAQKSEALLLQVFQAHQTNAPNALMQWRALGPAIACDLVRYLCERARAQKSEFTSANLIEALLLYVVPQFEGLERVSILEVYGRLCEIFKAELKDGNDIALALLTRIEELFPFVPTDDWMDKRREKTK